MSAPAFRLPPAAPGDGDGAGAGARYGAVYAGTYVGWEAGAEVVAGGGGVEAAGGLAGEEVCAVGWLARGRPAGLAGAGLWAAAVVAVVVAAVLVVAGGVVAVETTGAG